MASGPLFDVYCVVDWSANATPKRGADSIWVSEFSGETTPGHEPAAVNLPTRHAAHAHLRDLIERHTGRRVLIGFDFPLGYPEGFAAAARLAGAQPWQATWHYLAAHLTDDERNRNNRWAVAAGLNQRIGELRYWGAPVRRAGQHLTSRRPEGDAPRTLRHTEVALRSHTGRPPFTVWQLLGAGSVGSQTLTGIPVVHRLCASPRVMVWPFRSGFTADPCAGRVDAVVVAEVWPSIVEADDVLPKDRGQVLALARHFATLDRAGGLGELFAPDLPAWVAAAAVAEEGWVLGAASKVRQETS